MHDFLDEDNCQCARAVAWRWLCESEHVLSLLGEWSEWDRRRVATQTSRDLSAAGRWSGGTSYAEIERRRAVWLDRPPKTGAQLIAEARASWAAVEREIQARAA